jgi:hypothetical protein
MQKTVTILLTVARLLGVVQILGGLAIWFGLTRAVAFHSAIGTAFVLALWIISLIALFALSSRGLPLMTLLWGGLVLWFGMAQISLLPGRAHWAVRLAHLLVGIAAIGLVETLGKAVKRHWVARANAA